MGGGSWEPGKGERESEGVGTTQYNSRLIQKLHLTQPQLEYATLAVRNEAIGTRELFQKKSNSDDVRPDLLDSYETYISRYVSRYSLFKPRADEPLKSLAAEIRENSL